MSEGKKDRTAATNAPQGFGFSHKPLVAVAKSGITTFFRTIEVFGSDNVPTEGPIIFACTHSNMAIDPAVLSSTVPHGHLLHYWVKDSLFGNPIMAKILYNAGNIAVDRKTKDNQKLFKGTFEALARGESIGVFPEGTSYTQSHLIPLKDGTAWAALEYLRYLRGSEVSPGAKKGKKAVVVPVGIVYCDKAKFRSRVVVHYGEPITMDPFEDEFLSEKEGASRNAVKRLVRKIELEFYRMTVNSPGWDTAYAAQMARELLFEKEDALTLENFVDVSQTLSDLFTTSTSQRIAELKSLLVTYHRLLLSSRLSNSSLTDLPLPKTLDPKQKLSAPSRFLPLWLLVKDTTSCLIRLPFFLIPLLAHLPIYAVGILGAKLVEDEMETQAQMKVAFGLILSLITYPVLFFVMWAVFRQVPAGVILAAATVWTLRRYHSALIDPNYEGLKRLVAAWRLLIGTWLPKKFEYSLNNFIASASNFAPDPPKIAGLEPGTAPEKYKRPRHLPSRVLVRHVLRTRLEAARELMSVLLELEEKDAQVAASFWLAAEYGDEVDRTDQALTEWEKPLPRGTRSGHEVVHFLRSRGARIGRHERDRSNEYHWAATSGAETEAEHGAITGDEGN